MGRKRLLMVACVSFVVFAGAVGSASAQRKSVSGAEVTGTFQMNFSGHFRKFSNTVKIQALGKGKIHFLMDLVFPYKMRDGEDMVNMGGLDDEATIVADKAVYKSEDGKCTMTFHFTRPGSLKIVQEGSDAECGFGHNVFATGTYRKISSKKPNFEEGDI